MIDTTLVAPSLQVKVPIVAPTFTPTIFDDPTVFSPAHNQNGVCNLVLTVAIIISFHKLKLWILGVDATNRRSIFVDH